MKAKKTCKGAPKKAMKAMKQAMKAKKAQKAVAESLSETEVEMLIADEGYADGTYSDYL